MIRLRPAVTRSLLAFVLAVIALALVQGQKAAAPPRRIAVFGSSVANGTGDDLGKEGYTGRLRELLASRGWEVLNQSRGGDNTKTMAPRFAPEGAPDQKVRYLLTVNPSYALLGLSLGNEGIPERRDQGREGRHLQSVRIGDARVRRTQPSASHHPRHHAVLHPQRFHRNRVRVHAAHEPRDQRLGRAERQLPWRGGRWNREVGEGVLARFAAPERRRTRGAPADVRADPVRGAGAGQAGADPLDDGGVRAHRGDKQSSPG